VKKEAHFISTLKKTCHVPQSHISSACQQTGMRGETPFFRLPYFDYTKNLGVDVMHNLILGLGKEVTSEYLNP